MTVWTDFLILCAVWAVTILVLAVVEVRQQWQCRRYERHVDTALAVADPRPTLRVVGEQR